jgi:eukaryotic-like serine/threonine-protein kinase
MALERGLGVRAAPDCGSRNGAAAQRLHSRRLVPHSPGPAALTDPVRDRISTALSATHTVERELGGGGMARVFVATERSLGRQVVIKTLPDDSWTASAAQRFRREILTAAQLQHANIVPVLTAGDAEGMPYFTMPLVDGASLRERMARGAVPLAEAIGILRDVARALSAAHARSVVHRDIKPENILLSSGAALVTDFGVAKAVSAATQGPDIANTMTAIGVSVGTPAYMSPEQIAADPTLDHRADLYAWGVVAYELLSGQRPFAELTGTALMKAQMGTMPPPLKTAAPSIPVALADLVMRCLAKEPAARPQTATELLSVLDLPSGETRAAQAPPSRSRLALVAAAVLVIAVGAWWMLGRSSSNADEATIAVAPFRVGGAAPEAKYLREGLGDIIVPQLQTLPDISATGMRVMLDRWRRVAGSADDDLDDAAASRAAMDAGAGQLILGDVVGTRERLTVNARLIRTRDGREIARARVDGSADSVFSLATRLVTTLLAVSDGASQERLKSVLSANPEAIAPYLVGEQLYRRGRYTDAGQSFLAAYTADTTFAIAALRVELNNGWTLDDLIPGPWLERAWRHRARLSGTDSLLLISSVGETYPEPMPMRARIQSLEALANRSNTAEIWYAFADYLFHIGQQIDEPNPYGRALAGFKRAEAIDSSFAPALEHQAQLHLMLGDTLNSRLAHERQAKRDSTGDFFVVNDFLFKLTFGNTSSQLAAMDRVMARRPDDLLFLATLATSSFGPDGGTNLAMADSAIARFRRHATGPAGSLADRFHREHYWNTGQPTAARAAPAPESDILASAETVLAGLAWDADTMQTRRSVRALEAYVRGRPANDASLEYASAQFALAQWDLARGDTASVERRQRAIRTAAGAVARPWNANKHRVFDTAIGAQLGVARRAPDARARVEALDSLLIHAPELDRREVRTTGNLVLAELWERTGEAERALQVAKRRDGQLGYTMFRSERLQRVARLSRQLGRRDEERAALQEFVNLRVNAEPHLQPDVERARARLAELNASSER